MTRLVALHLPPDQLPAAMRTTWDDGDGVLPLPWGVGPDVVARILAAIRPHAVVEPASQASSGTRPNRGEGGLEGNEIELARRGLDAPQPIPDDTALVVTTSGSTGAPKGVVLSHRAVRASTQASLQRLGADQGQRFTLALPLHHVAGLQVVLRSWACGTEPEILPDASTEQIAAATGDHVSLVPTQLRRLLAAPDRGNVDRWRTILLGGARAGEDLLGAAAAAGATVVTSYGMTETCGGCVYDGRALDGVEVEVRDDERLRLRGPVLFSGYLGDPAATAAAIDADGWFLTGDRGEIRDHRLRVIGRADDVIISGGENVPASVVAEALRSHEGIADVAVIGRPDPEWGEVVVAVVVPSNAEAPPTLEELRDHLRGRQPAAFAPRGLVVVDALPRDGMGKVTAELVRQLDASTERPVEPG